MEAYLEVFERTAQQERWPADQWAHILSPFLTGPAQQASQDLTPKQASQYPELKQGILAYYGPRGPGPALPRVAVRPPGSRADSDCPTGEVGPPVAHGGRRTQPFGPGPNRQYDPQAPTGGPSLMKKTGHWPLAGIRRRLGHPRYPQG